MLGAQGLFFLKQTQQPVNIRVLARMRARDRDRLQRAEIFNCGLGNHLAAPLRVEFLQLPAVCEAKRWVHQTIGRLADIALTEGVAGDVFVP